MALIAHQGHLVQAEEHFLIGVHAFRSHGPGVLQVGVEHNHADDRTQEGIAAKDLGRGEGDENGQEGVGHVGKQIGKHKQRAAGVQSQESVVGHELQRLHDAHQEAGSHNGGDDGHKDVAQGLNGTLEPIALLGSLSLCLVLAHRSGAGQRNELCVHLIYRTSAQNDLELALCLEHALHAVGVLQGLLVHLFIVCNHQTKPGGTVGCADDIFRAANGIENFHCCLPVVHKSPLPCSRFSMKPE